MAQIGANAPRPRIEPCVGIDGAPCPHKKGVVVRGAGPARCPDCTLAQGRIRQAGKARKATPAKVDDQALLDRIARATPPGRDVVDGVLEAEEEEQDRCESCSEPATHVTADDVDLCEACYRDLQKESSPMPVEVKPLRAKELAKAPAAKRRRGPGIRLTTPAPSYKPGTRQPDPPPAKVTGEQPWWARAKPGEMTKTAHEERERMQNSKAAKQVSGDRIIE